MAQTVLISSGKGGVGKSTAAAFLSCALARRGRSVLLIDGDVTLGSLDIMLRLTQRRVFNWGDVLSGSCERDDALLVHESGVRLLSAPDGGDGLGEDCFARLVGLYGEFYDFIFIDSAAGADGYMLRAASACEKAVFVAGADEISVKAARAASLAARERSIEACDMRLLINRFTPKAARKCRLLNIDGVIDKTGLRLIGVLPEDKSLPYLSVTGKLPSASGRFMSAVGRVAARIDGQYVPLKLK